MSDDYKVEVQKLTQRAGGLQDGPAKVALLEEAVRLADTHNDTELGFKTREGLIKAGTFSGYPEKSLVAFSWCLAQSDREPEKFPERELLWEYKWVMSAAARFPQVSRQQIDEMIEDMTRRYQRCEAALRPVYKLRHRIAVEMGERKTARTYYRQWQEAKTGWPTDCPACERSDLVEYLVFEDEDELAVRAAAPILAGHLRCAEIPHLTLAVLLLPLLRLGRLEEAAACHEKGYRLVAGNREFIPQHGEHVAFLALTGNLARAARLLEKHLPWAAETAVLWRRFQFYLAARLLLERLRDAGEAALTLHLPQSFPAYREGGRYEVAALAAWLDHELADLAARFDARNGNDYFTRRIADNLRLKEQARPYPLHAGRPE
jgi:hypothetical protein